ncbi:NAD(P)-binding domain-containing protein [Raineya orbicola]|uniref:Flavin-containing monooxygenase 5 n=1 Tax=Raineya orbicola TaxID=2016530 RepID=A0A2N3IK25_9BACT|nr:NAD(P)-binding domain-containing protein [Raineya orbicola]PKQ70692.1 putative flavoprotein involved in K+ transport [Raineya orbicola]
MEHKVCIIGAGSSGIVACKVLQENNIPFDCYEKGSGIGGNWRYMNDNGMSSSYRSLHINTSKKVMAYSDFPMPEDYPDYPSHYQIMEYFESYVNHFGFRDKIRFKTGVERVEKLSDGSYEVTLDNGEKKIYTAVMVASGHHWKPRYPNFEGEFNGLILHSHDYKTPDIFQGHKNVVVVGFGNSAVDIACEAARTSTGKVIISTRSGAYVLPKYILGKPFDTLNKYSVEWLPMWFKRGLLSFCLWVARGKQENYGIPKPKRPLLSEHPTISQDLFSLAGHGKVHIKPNIQKLAGDTIIFEDGSQEKADVLIYATGYKIAFPFFDKNFLNAEETNEVSLYKHVIHPEHKNLFFIGLVQPLGAIMPLAEVQSEWVARILKGKSKLPSKEAMLADIESYKGKLRKRYKTSPRHTIQVDFYPYKNMIKRL